MDTIACDACKEVSYKLDKESCKAFNRQLSQIRVRVEHVFAQLKSFKILRNLFPLQAKRYATCFKSVALVCNMNLQEKNLQTKTRRRHLNDRAQKSCAT